MKPRGVSRNASELLGLMDTFLSRPKPKRWSFSKASAILSGLADRVDALATYLEPREVHVNERIVEMPFVLQRLPVGTKVLDVGSSSSPLALQLACLGYSVTAIDVRPYPFVHKNLRFHQEDIASCSIAPESHDCAILISTLEHMGLGAYGDSKGMSSREFLDTVAQYVKPKGRLLVTFPFGSRFEGSWYRVYDSESLATLLAGYEIIEKLFARRTSLLSFEMCDEFDLRDVKSESLPVNGVAMIEVRKRI
jgi:2-polyprenyl-3-methyl-5-hydroxy-6-metoxy-1,4-benzoquinol methylase